MEPTSSQDWAALVPELTVTEMAESLRLFELCAFADALSKIAHGRDWNPAPLEHPLGRQINLQVGVPDCVGIEDLIRHHGYELRRAAQDTWHRIDQRVEGDHREVLVQDTDGYLLRISQPLGQLVGRPNRGEG